MNKGDSRFHGNDGKESCLNVSALVTLAKKASLIFAQTITRGDEVLCQGTVRIACVDSQTMRPKAIPAILLEQLQNEC